MFDLFNVVKIKHNGIVGTIVDKTVIISLKTTKEGR